MKSAYTIEKSIIFYIEGLFIVFFITEFIYLDSAFLHLIGIEIERIALIWILNLGLLILFFILVSRKLVFSAKIWVFSFILFIISLIPILFYGENLFNDMKSLGLNVNIFAVFLFIPISFGTLRHPNNSNVKIKNILKAIYNCGFIASIYNLINIQTILSSFDASSNVYYTATSSFFDNKNTFGVVLAISIACGLYILRDNYKISLVIGLALQTIMMIISYSRGALLFLGVFAIIFFVPPSNRTKKINMLILKVALVVIILFIFFGSTIIGFFQDKVFRLESYGDAGRFALWQRLIDYFDFGIKEYFFGVGFSELNNSGVSYVHNIYLELFLVGGILKLLAYFIAFIYACKRIFSLKGKDNPLFLFCMSVLVGYLMMGIFDSITVFELGLNATLFTILLFMLPSICHNSVAKSSTTQEEIYAGDVT